MANRTYSSYTRSAVSLLGKLILLNRKERKLSAADLAERAGISRVTLKKIESGDLKCEIGLVFEAAALAGVRLFDTELREQGSIIERVDDKIALLPKSIRKSNGALLDDKF